MNDDIAGAGPAGIDAAAPRRMNMDKITRWKARRSGGRITITGDDETGHPGRWPNIDTIEPVFVGNRSVIVATNKDREEFELTS